MKIAHVNIRSLFTGFIEFSALVINKQFDVVMVTETWLSDDVLSDIVAIPGYRFIRKDRSTRGGGVGAYINLSYKCHELTFDFLVSAQLEYLFIKINLPSFSLAIGTFYRPPNTNINNFLNDFDEFLSIVCPMVDEVICMGDFNVNLFNIGNPIDSCFQSFNFTQLINEPTRITGTSSTLIDPIFVSNNSIVNNFGTISMDGISDHKMVFCDIKTKSFKMKPKNVVYRNFKNFDLNLFLADLHNLPWFNIISENDIDIKIKLFNDFISYLFDIHAPVKQVRVTKPRAPWLTSNLKLIMKERDRALQKYKRTHSNNDWSRYKELRNYTLTMVRSEKKGFLKSVCLKNNSKNTWGALKALNVCSNKEVNIPEELADPNEINNYFASFVQSVNNNCDNKIEYYNDNLLNLNISFSFSLTSVKEVNTILHNIKTDAIGIDGISSTMLKYCSPFIDKFITHIINCCIEKKYFPHMWKVAVGKPLPKKNDPSALSDLRVISVLPAISKIFERILYDQVYNYFILNKLLPDSQCGFRKGYSTTTALAVVTNDLLEAFDKGLVSVLVLLDFSKAFDTINHKLICAKLKFYGFDQSSVAMISSYLEGRSQKISVNNKFSTNLNILSGVPQGSILGPLLFIIYTADILCSISNCKVQAYADDTVLYSHFAIENTATAGDLINLELDKIRTLSIEHNLNLNSSKSNLMLFGAKNKVNAIKNILNINIDGTTLPIVNKAKSLGVTFDSDMRFKSHIKNLMQKSFSSLKLIYACRHILNFNLRKMLCESLVLSHFNYCDVVFGFCIDEYDKRRIQKVQNSCCRIIFGLRKYDRISHKIKECKWLNMNNRRVHHLCTFVHKIVTNPESSLFLRSKFIKRSTINRRNIRFKNKFTMPQHQTAMFRRSFIFNAITTYNLIPDQFKAFNINKFKYKIKICLLSKQ